MAQQVVISFNANANFSDLVGEIQRANAAIGTLQTQLNGLGSAAFPSIQNLNKQFIEGMRNSRMWSSSFVDVTNETREFGRQLDRGRLKLKDYFREFNLQVRGQRGMIRRLAEEQVKLQRSILTTTVGPQGESRYMLSTPTGLNKEDMATARALRAEQFKIIGRSIQGVSTELINLGKNTQWAGRQLTVGLTVPLTLFAASAARSFAEVDKQLTRLAKVYGDVGGATTGELDMIRKETQALSLELAQALGAPAAETIALAADIAATGKQGQELLKSVAETTRLSVLGEVDRQAAMEATLSLQNAFNLSTKELSESINFLNAVENQTSTSLQDLITAIPKAGPVVKSLGGDVKDLALFLSAMIEGGINASEAANALKSGLASIINPTKQTTEVMAGFGINIQDIVNKNAGDLVGTVTALQKALEQLDPLSKSKAIEQLFGKFQFARMSALFDNLGASGSQTLQVMQLMGASTVELAAIADRELSALTESASGKFQRQIETLRANLATTGESFLGIFTKVLGMVNKVLEGFNNLPDGVKNVITIVGALVGLAGPLIMLSGVFLNFFGYLVKSVGFLGRLFTGTKKFEMLDEQLMAVNLSGDKTANMFYDQAKAADVARNNIDRLIQSMQRLVEAQEASVATQAATPVTGAGSRFLPRPVFQSSGGVRPAGLEYSHGISEQGRIAMTGMLGMTPEEVRLLSDIKDGKIAKTVGNLTSLTKIVAKGSPEAALQQAFGEDMPNFLAPAGTSVADLRKRLQPVATTDARIEALRSATDETILRSFQDPSQFAEIQGVHVANLTAISQAYERSAKDGQALQRAIRDAWKKAFAETGDEAAAARAAAEVAKTELGQGYAGVVTRTKNEILTAFRQDGADAALITAAKAELNALRAGVLKQVTSPTTIKGITRLSLAVATAGADIPREVEVYQTKIRSAVKEFGTVTVRLIDGVAVAIAKGNRELTAEEMASDPKIQAAIDKLVAAKRAKDQALVQDAQETIAAERAMETALRSGPPEAAAVAPLTRGQRVRNSFRVGGMGSSMAMMGLGMATTMLPTGGVGDIAGGAMMGASMGAMFGAPGAAVGAALGALIPAIKMATDEFKKMIAIQRLSTDQYKIDKEFAKAAGLNLKTIADIQLEQLTGKSQEAASALEVLAQAALEAGLETSTGKLRTAAEEAKSFKDIEGQFRSQYLSYIAAGVSEETAKQMMAAILKASGREEFSTDLRMMINAIGKQTQQTSTARLLAQTGAGNVAGTNYQNVFNQLNAPGNEYGISGTIAERFITNPTASTGTLTAKQTEGLNLLKEAFNQLNTEQQQFILGFRNVSAQVEVLNNALANQSADIFAENMAAAARAGTITQEAVDRVASSISGLTDVDKSVLQNFKARGIEGADVMLALKMRVEGTITSLEELAMFDGKTIRLFFEAKQAEKTLAEAKATLTSALENMNTTAGVSPNIEAQKKALQAQIDALEEIERKEKNINKLKELALKYEEKRRNLVLDYLSATAGGDLEGALRTQLEMQAASAEYARERAQTEKEISREDRKKSLQDQLKALDSAATSSVGKVANKAKDLEKSINDAIASTLDGFKGKDGKVTMAFDEFVKSPAFTNFESRFKNILSPEAYTAAVAALKAGFKALEAELNLQAAGIEFDMGTRKKPREITGYVQSLGIMRPGGGVGTKSEGVQTALSAEQKAKILKDLATSGQILEGEYVTIFGEKYQLKGNDLIRHKNAQGLWMGGKVKGYLNGGYIGGIGNSISDSNLIAASKGEFMQNARAVEYYGASNMEKLNSRIFDRSIFDGKKDMSYQDGDVNVTIGNINITEPGASADEIIARIKKDLGAAVKRTTDNRRLTV